jgi:hypothetical protein
MPLIDTQILERFFKCDVEVFVYRFQILSPVSAAIQVIQVVVDVFKHGCGGQSLERS